METVYIGRIVKAHGLSGAVKIAAYSGSDRSFRTGDSVIIDPGKGQFELVVQAVQQSGGGLRVSFQGIETRTQAEELVHREIAISFDKLEELPEGEHYVFDIVGCSVVDETGAAQGVVSDVMVNPGNDLLIVNRDGKEFYIPFVGEFIKRIDLEARMIRVSRLEGFFE